MTDELEYVEAGHDDDATYSAENMRKLLFFGARGMLV